MEPGNIYNNNLITDLIFDKTDNIVYFGDTDGQVKGYRFTQDQNKNITKIKATDGIVRCLEQISASELIAGAKDPSLSLLYADKETKSELRWGRDTPPYTIRKMDEALVAVGCDDGSISIFDTRQGEEVGSISQFGETVTDLL